jgi:16S rRNA (uracil1498-N3)-methyltransferase
VNILILDRQEIGIRLPRSDRRWEHVKKVLKKGPGDRLAGGVVPDGENEGELGEAIVRELDEGGLVLDFESFEGSAGRPPDLAPLRLILGFPRPIQANRILKDLTSFGVAQIYLTGTELGEKSYAQSSIFKGRDFRAPLIEGAEQAGNPRLPKVLTHWTLKRCLDALGSSDGSRIFLHPYGDPPLLGAIGELEAPVTLAIGSERGWTEAEVALLRAAGFEQRGLGSRILKTETASVASVAIALAGLGLL